MLVSQELEMSIGKVLVVPAILNGLVKNIRINSAQIELRSIPANY